MTRTLHIVYFNYMQDLYGSSIGSTIKAERLLENLQNMGHHVRQYWPYRDYVPSPGGSGPDRSGISLKPLLRKLLFTPKELLKNLLEMFREYRFLRQDKTDVVIVRIDAYRYSSALLCKLLKIPLVLEVDGANSYEWLTFNNRDGIIWKSWLLFFEKKCFEFASAVFVQTEVAKQYYTELYPAQAGKIHIITNGADLRSQDPKDSLRNELNIPRQAIVCGFVGSMHYWHNTGLLTGMLANLMPQLDDFYMVLVGSGGPMAESLKQQCSGHEWQNRVIFTGYVPYAQTHRYINIMDITLAPYGKTGLFYYSPVKVFEYMAQGRAIITSPVGQITELIQDGTNGLFFDPDTDGDLDTKVLRLVRGPELRKTLGNNAREFIAGKHTWAHKARQLEQLCLEFAQ